MWQVERHGPRYVNVRVSGNGLPAVKQVELPGYYTIRDTKTDKCVGGSTEYPKHYKDFAIAVDYCAWLISQDYPEEVKDAPK